MKQTKTTAMAVLFFGALWGLTEATLGYLLHLVPGGLSGFILYPIGLAFMLAARRATGKQSAIFYVAAIAAAIKLVDFIIPGAAAFPQRIINPAIAILLEGLVSFVIVSATARSLHKPAVLIGSALSLSLAWRLAHVGLLLVLPWQGILGRGSEAVISFLFIEGVVNSFILLPVLLLHQRSLAGKGTAVFLPRIHSTGAQLTVTLGVLFVAAAAEILTALAR